jgi:hypothetical protein
MLEGAVGIGSQAAEPIQAQLWASRNDAVTPLGDGHWVDGQALEVLVLRAWLEPAAKPRLRVRVVKVTPGQAERSVLTATSVEDACEAVRNWLTDLQQPAEPLDS